MARINIRYKTLAKMAPRKWGKDGHGYGEPAPAVEAPRNGDDARKLDQHPLKEQIMAWQRLADEANLLARKLPHRLSPTPVFLGLPFHRASPSASNK